MSIPLLDKWHKGIRIEQIAHLRAAAHFGRLHRRLGVPVTVFSIIVGTSVFGSLNETGLEWLLIIAGVLSVLAAVLSGLQTFLSYESLAMEHQAAGTEYGKLRHFVEEMRVVIKDEAELEKKLPEVREAWDRLLAESPALPQRFVDMAMEMVKRKGDRGGVG